MIRYDNYWKANAIDSFARIVKSMGKRSRKYRKNEQLLISYGRFQLDSTGCRKKLIENDRNIE